MSVCLILCWHLIAQLRQSVHLHWVFPTAWRERETSRVAIMSYVCGFHVKPYFTLLSPTVRTHFTLCCARMSGFWARQQTFSTPGGLGIKRYWGEWDLSVVTFYLGNIPFLGSHGNLHKQACPTNEDRRVSVLPRTVTAAQAQETPSEAPPMLSQLFGGITLQGPWVWEGWRSDETETPIFYSEDSFCFLLFSFCSPICLHSLI